MTTQSDTNKRPEAIAKPAFAVEDTLFVDGEANNRTITSISVCGIDARIKHKSTFVYNTEDEDGNRRAFYEHDLLKQWKSNR